MVLLLLLSLVSKAESVVLRGYHSQASCEGQCLDDESRRTLQEQGGGLL